MSTRTIIDLVHRVEVAEGRVGDLEHLLAEIKKVRILMSKPPGPESDFVEVKDGEGRGIRVGKWKQEGAFWVLTLSEIDKIVDKPATEGEQ